MALNLPVPPPSWREYADGISLHNPHWRDYSGYEDSAMSDTPWRYIPDAEERDRSWPRSGAEIMAEADALAKAMTRKAAVFLALLYMALAAVGIIW